MDDWKQSIRSAKRVLSRSRSNQRNGKYATSCKNMKNIKPSLNKVVNKVVNEVMKDSDSDTDNDDEGEFRATTGAAGRRYNGDTADSEWISDPWGKCAQPDQLAHRTIPINRRRYNVIVTCNNGRTTRRKRGGKLLEEVYLALSERDEYIELERQINAAVASYKELDIHVPRRFLKAQMPILAPFADSYYRGRVVAVNMNKSCCKVCFVDYGNEEDDVLIDHIYPMQLHFSLLPAMAFPAWIPAGLKMLQEGTEFAVITERMGPEGIVQVRRYGPQKSVGTIAEMDELDDVDVAN